MNNMLTVEASCTILGKVLIFASPLLIDPELFNSKREQFARKS